MAAAIGSVVMSAASEMVKEEASKTFASLMKKGMSRLARVGRKGKHSAKKSAMKLLKQGVSTLTDAAMGDKDASVVHNYVGGLMKDVSLMGSSSTGRLRSMAKDAFKEVENVSISLGSADSVKRNASKLTSALAKCNRVTSEFTSQVRTALRRAGRHFNYPADPAKWTDNQSQVVAEWLKAEGERIGLNNFDVAQNATSKAASDYLLTHCRDRVSIQNAMEDDNILSSKFAEISSFPELKDHAFSVEKLVDTMCNEAARFLFDLVNPVKMVQQAQYPVEMGGLSWSLGDPVSTVLDINIGAQDMTAIMNAMQSGCAIWFDNGGVLPGLVPAAEAGLSGSIATDFTVRRRACSINFIQSAADYLLRQDNVTLVNIPNAPFTSAYGAGVGARLNFSIPATYLDGYGNGPSNYDGRNLNLTRGVMQRRSVSSVTTGLSLAGCYSFTKGAFQALVGTVPTYLSTTQTGPLGTYTVNEGYCKVGTLYCAPAILREGVVYVPGSAILTSDVMLQKFINSSNAVVDQLVFSQSISVKHSPYDFPCVVFWFDFGMAAGTVIPAPITLGQTRIAAMGTQSMEEDCAQKPSYYVSITPKVVDGITVTREWQDCPATMPLITAYRNSFPLYPSIAVPLDCYPFGTVYSAYAGAICSNPYACALSLFCIRALSASSVELRGIDFEKLSKDFAWSPLASLDQRPKLDFGPGESYYLPPPSECRAMLTHTLLSRARGIDFFSVDDIKNAAAHVFSDEGKMTACSIVAYYVRNGELVV